MNTTDIMKAISAKNNISQRKAYAIIADIFKAIAHGMKFDDWVRIANFGSFKMTKLAASDGRNPFNQEKIKIPARNRVRFRAHVNLKRLLNQ